MYKLPLLAFALGIAGCNSGVSEPLTCPDDLPFLGDDGRCYVDRLHAQSYATCGAYGLPDEGWLDFAQTMIAAAESGATRLDILQLNAQTCDGDLECEECLDSITATVLR